MGEEGGERRMSKKTIARDLRRGRTRKGREGGEGARGRAGV